MGRVLVVDDDADVRAALRMLLEDDGHSIVELDDGRQVPEIASERGVDVILLDLSMPQVDGFEVLSMLLLDQRTASIPVIVVSARGRPDDRAQAMALGASDYITKPWGEGEVEFRVRMAMGRSERKWAEENQSPGFAEDQGEFPGQQPAVSPASDRSAASRVQLPATVRAPRPARPQRPAPPPLQTGSPPIPGMITAQMMAQTPAVSAAPPRVRRRRPRVRRIVRRIRRRAA